MGPFEASPVPLPAFGTGDERLEVALTVLGLCAINESIASSWIRACFARATGAVARFANREHLADEIDHARLGWAHLASSAVTEDVRTGLRSRVADMIAVNVAAWKRADAHLPEEGIPEQGHLPRHEHDAVVDDAVRTVVVPGLAHVGLA